MAFCTACEIAASIAAGSPFAAWMAAANEAWSDAVCVVVSAMAAKAGEMVAMPPTPTEALSNAALNPTEDAPALTDLSKLFIGSPLYKYPTRKIFYYKLRFSQAQQ